LLIEKWRNDAEDQLRTGNKAKNGRVSNKTNLGKRSQQDLARRHRMEGHTSFGRKRFGKTQEGEGADRACDDGNARKNEPPG
jgi:hypothetical protein